LTLQQGGISIVSMYVTPLSIPQKVGAIFYGLAAGLGVAIATSVALCLLGVVIALFANYTRWIPSQPWLPLVGLEQGFLLGIVLGAIVCWRVWRTRLGETGTQ
jgi:hypothetical protein